MGRIMYGLLGEKLGHSLSPSIHKMIFEELGIDAGYNLFEVEKHDLKDAMAQAGIPARRLKDV